MGRTFAFWLTVGLVAVIAVVTFKLLAARIPWSPLQAVAGAI